MDNLYSRSLAKAKWVLKKKQKYLYGIAPFLSKNYQGLLDLEDKHCGEKAVVIGMGPSLRRDDLNRLQGFTSFACNKIYLAFEETKWRPDYYSINDVLVAENNLERIINSDFGSGMMLHSEIVKHELSKQQGARFYGYRGSLQNLPNHVTRFSKNIADGIRAGGYSICIDQLQLAFHMGFEAVYLLGVDFSIDVKAQSIEGDSKSGKVLKSEGEQNHFHPDYRKPGETWTVPMMKEQQEAFEICAQVYRNAGRKLYNASRMTCLNVVERTEFDHVFRPKDAIK